MLELIQQLMTAAGISREQAEGGAGLLLGLVKEGLSGEDFTRLAAAVPGLESLMQAAPAAGGGLGGLLGSAFAAFGQSQASRLAGLAEGFASLGLDLGDLGKFIPVLLAFLQSHAGEDLAEQVGRVLRGA